MAVDPLNIPRWVVAAGWSGQDAITATAVALRHADPAAPGGLFGLGTGGGGADQAKAARARQQAEGWTAFPAYRDGSYRLLLPAATVALAALTPSIAVDKVAGAATSVTDATQAAGRAAGWLINPRSWERITQVALGVMFVVGGGFFLAKRVGYDPAMRMVSKVDHAIARQTGLSADVGGGGFATGGGSAPTSAPTGQASSPAPSVPKPPPPARPKPTPAAVKEAAPKTSPLNPDVARTKGVLGQLEAQMQGHAPFKGRAKRPPVKIPAWK